MEKCPGGSGEGGGGGSGSACLAGAVLAGNQTVHSSRAGGTGVCRAARRWSPHTRHRGWSLISPLLDLGEWKPAAWRGDDPVRGGPGHPPIRGLAGWLMPPPHLLKGHPRYKQRATDGLFLVMVSRQVMDGLSLRIPVKGRMRSSCVKIEGPPLRGHVPLIL